MRFGLTWFPADPDELVDAAQLAEGLGFDALYTADHLFVFSAPERPFLDGWVTLAGWAQRTSRIRLGMLVTNLSWRDPVQVARTTVALDQVTNGRFELGVGVGRFADQAMADVIEMSGAERVERLEEGLLVLDRLLQGDHSPFAGRYTTYSDAQTAPGCVQRPRPPLTVAAHGAKTLTVTAKHADVWSSYGDLGGVDLRDVLTMTARRSAVLDAACESIGREPTSIRRSLLLPPGAIDAWGEPAALAELVEELRGMHFDEVVFSAPPLTRRHDLERTALEVLPSLR